MSQLMEKKNETSGVEEKRRERGEERKKTGGEVEK